MRRTGAAKFPNSVQLFKFCHKVLVDKRNGKVHDQEVGAILNFNPSDCSHWKRGEKNVKSIFALARLAQELEVETTLIHDVASGVISLEEAYFEYQVAQSYRHVIQNTLKIEDPEKIEDVRTRIESFALKIHQESGFSTPPLYLPEVIRLFPYITSQQSDLIDKLSRILRVKPGHYVIQVRKGELRPQTRMSVVRDIAKIILQAERKRFPELKELLPNTQALEEFLFTANLLIPKEMMLKEMVALDSRRNILAELASLFWVPKTLVGFQLQELLRANNAVHAKFVSVKIESEVSTHSP